MQIAAAEQPQKDERPDINDLPEIIVEDVNEEVKQE